MNAAPSGTVGRAIAEYTGRQVISLDVVPDPNVPGVFAAHATMRKSVKKAFNLYFLIRVPLQKVTADDLEECEFTQWPPTVRS